MSWTQEKIQETVKAIQKKVVADAAFRKKFKTNPNATIEEIAGLALPSGFRLNVVDANDADLTIALPKTKSDELSDTDLEAVAGGKSVGEIVGDVVGGVVAAGAAVGSGLGDAAAEIGAEVAAEGAGEIALDAGLIILCA